MFKEKISQNFNSNGYVVIKNFLDTKEVNFFIKEIYKDLKINNVTQKLYNHSILIENPNYWKLFTNPKLINSVKEFLDTDEICFVQHTDLQVNYGSSIFDGDNVNRKFNSNPDWNEVDNKYGVVRVALYLSSYNESGSSLIVLPNTHKKQSKLQIKEIYLFNKIHSFFNKLKIQFPHFLFFSKTKKIKAKKGDYKSDQPTKLKEVLINKKMYFC